MVTVRVLQGSYRVPIYEWPKNCSTGFHRHFRGSCCLFVDVSVFSGFPLIKDLSGIEGSV